ncbi:hypothetical protein LOTGIDRAFT_168837 [Lottia gigantea]|uniref:SAM domain-containing protein n=1 Tax=Lottia gigantea TaxID=225164 RepID=V3ZU02_LOTGI|nr:hypothetical protein LOTGIDRAFT_168837 [Lottia gigantea]ESO84386.1 hypothetical protein LOTGIDRAFT_168837 [Lottia gigantea]
MANFLPGGAEEFDDEDDFFMDDDDIKEVNSFDQPRSSPSKQNIAPENADKSKSSSPFRVKLTVEDLRVAAIRNNVEKLKRCLQQGFPVDAILTSGWSVLMYAANSSNPDSVAFLLENGADPNFETNKYSVLMAACSSNQPADEVFECVRLLVEKGAQINDYDRYHISPLISAAREGQVEVVKYLLDNGATINKQDTRGWSALSWATHRNQVKVVKLLLNEGCNQELKHTDGLMPVDLAIGQDNQILIDILEGKKPSEMPQTKNETKPQINGGNDNTHSNGFDSERKLENGSGDHSNSKPPPRLSNVRESDYTFNTSPKVSFNSIREAIDHSDRSDSKEQESSDSKIKSDNSLPSLQVKLSDFVKFGELELFLQGLGLSDFVELFQQQYVNFETFLCLNEEDLINMGIQQLGVRKKILEGIQAVHKRDWESSSLISPQYKTNISIVDAVAMVSNLSRHLLYISSSIVYINDQIKKNPHLLINTQGNIGAKHLTTQTTDALQRVNDLKTHINTLNKRLEKEMKLIDGEVPDVIQKRKNKSGRARYFKILVGVILVPTLGILVWKHDNVSHFISQGIDRITSK